MKKYLLLFGLIFPFFTWANLNLNNQEIKDVAYSYGFYTGQELILKHIETLFPSMKLAVEFQRKNFHSVFGQSLKNIDQIMTKLNSQKWQEVKNDITKQSRSLLNFNLSKEQAQSFLSEIQSRSEGKLDPKILKTFLAFNPTYQRFPEMEFADGYIQAYRSHQHPKAKGIDFSIDVPFSWKMEEAKRPNIVQKFSYPIASIPASFMVMVKDFPIDTSTEQDVRELLANPNAIQEFIPANSEYIDSGFIQLEQLPGIWIRQVVSIERLDIKGKINTISYILFYQGKAINLQGMVVELEQNKPSPISLETFLPLFKQVINSFVIFNLYQ